jgi:hypothetical protein
MKKLRKMKESRMTKERIIMRTATGVHQRDRLERLNHLAGRKRHTWEDDVNKMNEILGEEENRGIIIDSHSAPRIGAIAGMWDLLPGWSLDLTVNDPDDGEPWDFNMQENETRLRASSRGRKHYWSLDLQCVVR